ncbi:hypothetical protein [Mycolicibacter longobardus]|uniref:Uncharacterized protein n=1 Tax=Mycolicibacter longobardus TaxID=1108812 RepID=A0A1X1YFW0_9MYCO|nr:hypothetical protein [Mycolicibacter longobardus]MCV7384720.1 hypothetical protein [Mycolicibacter longobardus]ORW09944.1 hypothetical protein AWC16_15625 [Mycolicibacter longobardus]
MSRIRNCLTVAAGAAAGLFLAALASSATANADTVPINPGLPGVVEQVVAQSTSIPQQLLQTTTSALSGTTLAPAATPGQSPIATATLNVPQAPGAQTAATSATGLPGLSSLPDSLSSVLPFPMPNFGGSAPVAATPTAFAPTGYLPSAPVAPVTPMEVVLIPGLP